MAELSTRESFIVRIYRYDPEETGKIAGLIEAADGSGVSEPFTDAADLGAIVNRFVGKRRKPPQRTSGKNTARRKQIPDIER